MRICSLLPSATETLYALGLGDSVVGITHECDYPPEAADKPALIRPRVDPAASPAEVDERVSELVERGESIYGVDDELLRRLEPDLIITQDLCHVCAASPDDLATALTRLEKVPRVLSLTPHTMADVWDDIRRIGDATDRESEAEKLVAELKNRVSAVEQAAGGAHERPRVVCLEWPDPAYVGGHWVPQMVTRAGGVDALGHPGEPSYRVPWSRILDARPEVIVVMPCGYNVARTVDEFKKIKFPARWGELPAVRDGRVFAVDANSYFSRPSPRLADGIALLAQLFHPSIAIRAVPTSAARKPTMAYAMEEAAKRRISFYVLDRPNPLGGEVIEGPLLDRDRVSFVGYFSMPVRYGLTLGELAQMFNAENKIGADLHVVAMKGWRRRDTFEATGVTWIPPSPNLRTPNAALLYPGIEILQAGGVSVGRGTDTPFEVFGAPWIQGAELAEKLNRRFVAGVRFVPTRFTPRDGMHKDQPCDGISLIIIDRVALNSMLMGLEIASVLWKMYPEHFAIDKLVELVGNENTIERLKKGDAPTRIVEDWEPDLEVFQKIRAKYLIYP